MHNGEAVEYSPCQLSTVLLKPRLSVNCQHCCWSHVVIEAKEHGFLQGKTASPRKHTTEHFPGDKTSASFDVKRTAYCVQVHELTIDSVFIIMAFYWLGVGKWTSASFDVKWTAYCVQVCELTIDSVFILWSFIDWGWANVAASCVTQVTAIWWI